MESELAARRAALRRLLVAQVEATAPPPRRPATVRGAQPGRLRMVLVTTGVAVAVVAASAAALQLSRPHGPDAAAPVTDAASTATPRPAPELVTPAGWREITRPELHAFVAEDPALQQDPTHGAIWEEQAWLEIRCMATAGFVYDPIAVQRSDSGALPGLTEPQVQRYAIALHGEPTGGPYDWRHAGCVGTAVHETGQDGAH